MYRVFVQQGHPLVTKSLEVARGTMFEAGSHLYPTLTVSEDIHIMVALAHFC